jgi:hypothetical protein
MIQQEGIIDMIGIFWNYAGTNSTIPRGECSIIPPVLITPWIQIGLFRTSKNENSGDSVLGFINERKKCDWINK